MAQQPGATVEELVEHVDDDDCVIGIVTRTRMRAENLLHRSVAIIVQATDGRLLVHRRSDDKDLFPGWWDLAAGGVVGIDESYPDAARRELAEELGVVAEPTFVRTARHDDEHARELCHVYRVTHDGPFRFDDGEVTEARLVDAAELDGLIDAERVLPGALAMIRPLVDLGPSNTAN